MKFIADFHIHSHYSIATSKQLIPEYLDYWSRLKGITLVGSGDFTHPGWVKELQEKLEPAEEGLFRLKKEYRREQNQQTPFLPEQPVRFLLTAEISSIYKKKDKVRKIHSVIFAPGFDTVKKIQRKLQGIGANITSDGRPILGLDAKDLLELALECSPRIFFVPAHIWTPWFSVLGDRSGFETIEECFEDLTSHIHTVETGLSSDPPMNWMCSFLDKFTLVSNSDAHSPEKLGRNANRFDTDLSYDGITGALETGDPRLCLGTIDLFPQEGKYHYDGHRKCGVSWNPVETLENGGICPVCGKPVTVGVMNRVVRISDREDLTEKENRLPFYSIIPLKEILGEIMEVSPTSRKVDGAYFTLLKKGIPELQLLLDTPVEEIALLGGDELAEAIRRMRNRQVIVKEGFDGEYGRVKVFRENEKGAFSSQKALFGEPPEKAVVVLERRKMIDFDLRRYRELSGRGGNLQDDQGTLEPAKLNKSFVGVQGAVFQKSPLPVNPSPRGGAEGKKKMLTALNTRQREAVLHFAGPALILAGPGTGKTRVLAYRVVHLIEDRGIDPGFILAVTFTNRAATEMKERLQGLLADKEACARMQVATFHALGLSMLKELLAPGNTILPDSLREEIGRSRGFSLIDREDRELILKRIPGIEKRQVNKYSDAIGRAKRETKTAAELEDKTLSGIFADYENLLKEQGSFDLDDLIYVPVRLFHRCPGMREYYQNKYRWIMIDEYQDINYAQYCLISSLVPGEKANLYVIGDPDQAIYGFRGADAAFIKKFSADFPGAALYRLEKSYRCSESILRASRDVMGRTGVGEISGGLLQGMDKGVKIKIAKHGTHKSEAEFVARTIEDMIGGLRFFSMDSSITRGSKSGEIESLSDFAVLCRLRGQLEVVEKACRDHAIPFRTIGEAPFFKQEPVRSIIDLLRLLQDPGNSFLKEKINNYFASGPTTWAGVKGEINGFAKFKAGETVREVIAALVDNIFAAEKKENEILITRLLELAGNFGHDMESFLRFVLLGAAEDTYAPGLENVTLMTLHAAKGLEFKCVFIVGCEEGLLPYSLYESQTCDREEERRLLLCRHDPGAEVSFFESCGEAVFARQGVPAAQEYFSRPHRKGIDRIRANETAQEKRAGSRAALFIRQ